MKSIKPGRGPSMMGGVVGIFMIGFGILWTVIAAQASGIFAIFGVLWTGIAVVMTVYNFKNATGKNRHSSFDIVDAEEEPDPLNERFGNPQANTQKKTMSITSSARIAEDLSQVTSSSAITVARSCRE